MNDSEKRLQEGSQLDQRLKKQNNETTRERNALGSNETDNHNANCESTKEPNERKDYFANYNGSKMTVVFHAVLSPNFKCDRGQGDKIFMRFAGVRFGNFSDNVVEVYPER